MLFLKGLNECEGIKKAAAEEATAQSIYAADQAEIKTVES